MFKGLSKAANHRAALLHGGRDSSLLHRRYSPICSRTVGKLKIRPLTSVFTGSIYDQMRIV